MFGAIKNLNKLGETWQAETQGKPLDLFQPLPPILLWLFLHQILDQSAFVVLPNVGRIGLLLKLFVVCCHLFVSFAYFAGMGFPAVKGSGANRKCQFHTRMRQSVPTTLFPFKIY